MGLHRPRSAPFELVADKLVNTNGAAVKVMYFDRLGKKVPPGTFGKTKVGYRVCPKSPSVKKHYICSDPISADPMCPFPIEARLVIRGPAGCWLSCILDVYIYIYICVCMYIYIYICINRNVIVSIISINNIMVIVIISCTVISTISSVTLLIHVYIYIYIHI